MTGAPSPKAPSSWPLDLDDEDDLRLAVRVGQAWKELRRGAAMVAVRDWFYGEGDDALEPGQVDTLDLLAQRDTWRMGDLADALRVDPSTATRAVHRLVKAGLAHRTACRDDGRVVMVAATTAGLQRHEAIVVRRREALAFMLGDFSPSEREDLADLLERFVGALDRLAAELPHTGP
jgi:DNA-binding MarR family transcriptional regulator